MDILGPLPTTENGNKYILLIIDYFSKWPIAVALPDVEAATIARAFVDNIVCHMVFVGLCILTRSPKWRQSYSSV